jgi:hypothetical protein
MGYLLAFLIIVLLGVLLVPVLARRRAPHPQGGTLAADHPVSRTEPAADEVNPAKSVTASERQRDNAAKRTPPS